MKELVTIRSVAEVNRRELLRLFAAGVAALEVGCLAEPGDAIVPYVVDPPEAQPGVPVRYASTLTLDGYAQGVIVETRDGRPYELQGNPAHPETLGASTPILQARILDLYDPQRAKEFAIAGEPSSWEQVRALLGRVNGRVWLVMPPTSSATVAMLLERLRARCELHVVWDAPLGRREALRGHQLALGEVVEALPDLDHAPVIATLDSDWLATKPGWARRFGPRRGQVRLWVCEPAPTPTGTIADEHLAVRASDVAGIAAVLAGLDAPALPPAARMWADRLRDELARRGGAIIVGDRQPAIVHALARLAEQTAGRDGHGAATGGATQYVPCPLVDPLGGETLADLEAAQRAGAVDALVVIDCNPTCTRGLVPDAPLTVCASLHPNETSRVCQVVVPLAHELEAWADARAQDGTRSVAQPVIRPRFPVASPVELLTALVGEPREARLLVREASGLDEIGWRDALARGVIDHSAEAPRTLTATRALPALPAPAEGIEIALAPSRVHDGRFAANAWLQELPHPLTKQTWGNAALIAPEMAARLDVKDGQLLHLETPAGHIEIPAIIVPGCVDRSVTVELGYGRIVPELPIAHAVGANGYRLRAGDALVVAGAAVPVARHVELAVTQHEFSERGREVAPKDAERAARLRGPQPSLIPEPSHVGWGMTIDTAICTGCSACMVACQAENNLAIVGADQVRRGRHMNWIRVDLYREDSGGVVNQPVPCQHCEDAPCEYVCPVEATEHSPDGLNEMVYNRCVGTRFCSNNCPYKVRRFNWFAFERQDETQLQYNPDVTVRSRGVMEKCTYCVQGIRRAEITARVEDRAIAEGEVETACMQACPTGAIQFGNLAERTTAFARSRKDPRRYDLLHDLGTRPRTIYLAKVRK